MKRRPLALAVAAVAALALCTGSLAGTANADQQTAPGAAVAQASQSTQLSGLGITGPTITLGTSHMSDILNALGLGSTGALTTALQNTLTPLTNTLTSLPSTLTTSLSNAVTGAGLQATNPTTQQPRPAAGTYPTCGQQGWTSSDCYSVIPSSVASSTVGLNIGLEQGYATGDDSGYIAGARVSNPQLSLLGVNLGNLGVADSTSQCGLTSATCSATQTLSGSSLLGGRLAISVSNGTSLVTLDGTQITGGSRTITVGGIAQTIGVNGNLVSITSALNLNQLLSALNLPNLLTTTLGTLVDTGSTVTLTTTIGPGSKSTGSPASAWGLDVQVDLQVDIKVNLSITLTLLGIGLLNVNVATIEIKTGGTPPDLLDLKLAYSKATAGSLLPGWVPSAVI